MTSASFKRRWWDRFLFALVLSVLWLLTFGRDSVKEGSREAMDLMVGVSAALTAPATEPPVRVIDVDEETWRRPDWGGGEPAIAPREGLLRLLEYAVASGARYVVLDVAVEGDNPGDAALAAGVEALARRLDAEGGRRGLLFVRTVRRPLEGGSSAPPVLRASILDAVIARHPRTLQVVSSGLMLSSDGLSRRWRSWTSACVAGGEAGDRWRIQPSAQLAIATSVRGAPPVWEAIGGPCVADPEASRMPKPSQAEIDSRMWRALDRLSAVTRQQSIGKDEESRRLTTAIFHGPDPWDSQRIPARQALAGEPEASLKGAIVFIGQTFQVAGDRYATPVGQRVGVRIAADSTASLLRTGMLRLPSLLTILFVYLGCILLTSFLFAWLKHTVASFFANLVVLTIGFGLSALALRGGIWLDFMTPVAMSGLIGFGYEMVEDVWNPLYLRSKKAWTHVGKSSAS